MKIIKDLEFTHKIDVFTPIDGTHKKESLKARYCLITWDEMQAIAKDAAGAGEDEAKAVLERVLVGAEDCQDEDGNPIGG